MKNLLILFCASIIYLSLNNCTKMEKEYLETKDIKHLNGSQLVKSNWQNNQNRAVLNNPFRNINLDSLNSTNNNNLLTTDDCCNVSVDIRQDDEHNLILFSINLGKGNYTDATNWHLVEQVILYDNNNPTGYVYLNNFYADNEFESCTPEFSHGFFISRQFGPCCTATGKIVHARVYQINNEGPFLICSVYITWFSYQNPNGQPCC